MKISKTSVRNIGLSIAIVGVTLITTNSVFASFKDSFDEVYKFGKTAGVNQPGDEVDFIITIMNVLLGLVAIISVCALLYAGFLMIADMGNEDDVKKAKNIIKYAIIGLILIGLSAVIVNLVINTVIKRLP